jgi:hypothetical protein
MKTTTTNSTLKLRKMLAIAMVLTLTVTSVTNAQDRIYLGMRVPQMTTQQRDSIGAETNPQNARGQTIFNTSVGKLKYWDGTEWMTVGDADPTPTMKQVTFSVENGKFSTEHLIFYGTTAKASKPLKIVGIEPVFSDPVKRRNFLTVESAVQVVENAAEWSVRIQNRNISSEKEITLESVIITYICDGDMEELTNDTQGYTTIVGF